MTNTLFEGWRTTIRKMVGANNSAKTPLIGLCHGHLKTMARSAQWHTSSGHHVNKISCMQLGKAAALPTEAPVFGCQFAPGGLTVQGRIGGETSQTAPGAHASDTTRFVLFVLTAMSHQVPGTCKYMVVSPSGRLIAST
ncbi:uncharacterized protein TrAtP1_002016 [Trichoderma atroviride]|uniref:uncharacterized protein n=1 Tax=Hypocrea atroviridis TaxID=63577 RepID=UPI0033296C9C|nr:hypothetical protein TrAtP1_002016 [Trichoderma atroviride]